MCCQLHHKSICCLLKIRTLTRRIKIFCATITPKDNLSEQTESNCYPLLASDVGLEPTNPRIPFFVPNFGCGFPPVRHDYLKFVLTGFLSCMECRCTSVVLCSQKGLLIQEIKIITKLRKSI